MSSRCTTPILVQMKLTKLTPQGTLCAFILQGRPKGSDDEVRRRSGSAAQPEDFGAAGCYSQESRHERAQTQMRQVPKYPRDGRLSHVP